MDNNNWETNQNYQPYQPYQPVQEPPKDETVKISEYLLILLFCTFLPCVGIILLFVFGFGKDENPSKKNFCRAYLITMGISLALTLIGVIFYVSVLAVMFS